MRFAALTFAVLVPLSGCGGDTAPADPDAAQEIEVDAEVVPIDADPTPDADPFMPATLRETGLYQDFENEILAEGVVEYRPEYELWSDGAEKRRFAHLPAGETIDTADMDYWGYPVGTKLWKEFSRDGVRVETRLLFKTGPEPFDWYMMPYLWNQEQTEAVAVPGGVTDALGTEHDVPSRGDCRKCHDKMPDRVLGFTATQLDHDLGGTDLAGLVADGRLTEPPTGTAPYFEVPGDATAQAALGYMDANCGGCHHESSPVMDNVALDLRLYAEAGTVEETAAYRTAVGVAPELSAPGEATALIEPGDPDTSAVPLRMADRAAIAMPPLGTELVHAEGLATVDAWIVALGQ